MDRPTRPPVEQWDAMDIDALRGIDVPGVIDDLSVYIYELEKRAAALCDAMDKAGLDSGGTWLQGALEELRALLPSREDSAGQEVGR